MRFAVRFAVRLADVSWGGSVASALVGSAEVASAAVASAAVPDDTAARSSLEKSLESLRKPSSAVSVVGSWSSPYPPGRASCAMLSSPDSSGASALESPASSRLKSSSSGSTSIDARWTRDLVADARPAPKAPGCEPKKLLASSAVIAGRPRSAGKISLRPSIVSYIPSDTDVSSGFFQRGVSPPASRKAAILLGVTPTAAPLRPRTTSSWVMSS
mmetsp:Transcript_28106/g.70531  ORF Transcript_28106/g.70531 Transcript_28106/m.70531 type:complete len:215 (-) Transcript_28106:3718-4362(-)